MGTKRPEDDGGGDSVVKSMLKACRNAHDNTKLATYMVRRGSTEIRFRPSGETTTREGLDAFVATLRSILPLGQIELNLNMLDGTQEACITVPNHRDEAAAARTLATQGTLARALKLALQIGVISLPCYWLIFSTRW